MRDQILRSAQEQLGAGGYANLNFAVIADHLSTTRTNLHHHFKSKERLATEATIAHIEQDNALLTRFVAQNPGDFPGFLTTLEQEFFIRLERDGVDGLCICTQLIRDRSAPEQLRTIALSYFEQTTGMIQAHIEQSKRAGVLRSDVDAPKLANEAATMMMGMISMGQIALASDKRDHMIAALRGTLINWVKNYQT